MLNDETTSPSSSQHLAISKDCHVMMSLVCAALHFVLITRTTASLTFPCYRCDPAQASYHIAQLLQSSRAPLRRRASMKRVSMIQLPLPTPHLRSTTSTVHHPLFWPLHFAFPTQRPSRARTRQRQASKAQRQRRSSLPAKGGRGSCPCASALRRLSLRRRAQCLALDCRGLGRGCEAVERRHAQCLSERSACAPKYSHLHRSSTRHPSA